MLPLFCLSCFIMTSTTIMPSEKSIIKASSPEEWQTLLPGEAGTSKKVPAHRSRLQIASFQTKIRINRGGSGYLRYLGKDVIVEICHHRSNGGSTFTGILLQGNNS